MSRFAAQGMSTGFSAAAAVTPSAAAVGADYAHAFDDLAADVLGDDTATTATAAAAVSRDAQLDDSGEAITGVPFLTFDFRRGAAAWPEGATLLEDEGEEMDALVEKVRKELLAQLQKAANDDEGAKKGPGGKENGSQQRPPSADGGGGGGGMLVDNSSSAGTSSEDEQEDSF